MIARWHRDLQVYDYQSGDFERTLKGHSDAVQDLAFDSSGKILGMSLNMGCGLHCVHLCSVMLGGYDHQVVGLHGDLRVRENPQRPRSQRLIRHIPPIRYLPFSLISRTPSLPPGDMLLSASRDQLIKLWELATGYCIRTFAGHREWVRMVRVCNDGSLFASCSNDKVRELFSSRLANDGKCVDDSHLDDNWREGESHGIAGT